MVCARPPRALLSLRTWRTGATNRGVLLLPRATHRSSSSTACADQAPSAWPDGRAAYCRQLAGELRAFDAHLSPTPEQYERKAWLLEKLQPLLEKHTGGELRFFGSCENGFWVKGSDIDTCLVVSQCTQRKTCLTKLRLVKILVEREGIGRVQVVKNARVPVAKICGPGESPDELADICINNTAALENSALVGTLSCLDPRIQPLGRFIKLWASRRRINERREGTLSTYTLLLQLFHFLQGRTTPILPRCVDFVTSEEVGPNMLTLNRDDMQGEPRPLPFVSDPETILRHHFPQRGNDECMGELIYDFFEVYGSDKFGGGEEGWTLDIYDGGMERNDMGVLAMRCPLTWKNVNPMTIAVWQSIHAEYRRAAELLRSGQPLAELCKPVDE